MELKLFLISRGQCEQWEVYLSAVVAAPDEETARNMNPADGLPYDWVNLCDDDSWCGGPDQVIVECIGTAAPEIAVGVILSDYIGG